MNKYEEFQECNWCEEEFETLELKETNLGMLCWKCIEAIKSKGEEITITE